VSSRREIPKVSVVVASKNEIAHIEKCIESLLNQTYEPSAVEILVYDGLSSDGTKEYLIKISTIHPRVKIFDNNRIVAAAGWNEGFIRSNADYVVMMGAHTHVDPNFVSRNVEILENENVPCSGGSVIAVGDDFKSKAIAFAFNHPFGVGNAKYRYSTSKCYVETINYGMYRKSVVDDKEIGPLNEELKRGEDWEYNYKIVKKYGKMAFSPEIKSYYSSRSNFKRLWRRQFDAGFYKLQIIAAYPKSLLFRHIIPFIFVLSIIISTLLALAGFEIYLFIIGTTYIMANLLTSTILSMKYDLKYLLVISWSFFIIHFAYGLGILFGLFKFLLFGFKQGMR